MWGGWPSNWAHAVDQLALLIIAFCSPRARSASILLRQRGKGQGPACPLGGLGKCRGDGPGLRPPSHDGGHTQVTASPFELACLRGQGSSEGSLGDHLVPSVQDAGGSPQQELRP